MLKIICKVTLKHLAPKEGQDESEVVHARFVLGTDGMSQVKLMHDRYLIIWV